MTLFFSKTEKEYFDAWIEERKAPTEPLDDKDPILEEMYEKLIGGYNCGDCYEEFQYHIYFVQTSHEPDKINNLIRVILTFDKKHTGRIISYLHKIRNFIPMLEAGTKDSVKTFIFQTKASIEDYVKCKESNILCPRITLIMCSHLLEDLE